MSHDELAQSLAAHLRGPDRMTWCDMQLGPAGSPRPDVFTLQKSFVRPTPMVYECKVSVADFRADATTGKWQTYLEYACGVYFAVPAGLVSKGDVPDRCGLMVLGEKGWRAAKRPILQPAKVPYSAMLKLVIDGVEREGPRHRASRMVADHALMKRLARELGEDVALAVKDLDAARQRARSIEHAATVTLANAEREAAAIKANASEREAEAAPKWRELLDVLGLAPDSSEGAVRRAIAKLRLAQEEHPAESNLRMLAREIHGALRRAGVGGVE